MLQPNFKISLACDDADLREAQRLRFDVFVDELGGDGPLVDHHARLERDAFDPHADHLILRDLNRPPGAQVVGAYRLLRGDAAERAGGFYSAREFDLARLQHSGRSLLELGRSCVHSDYRGGTAMLELWSGLADYVTRHGIELLFGVASFHGTDLDALAPPLSILHHRHLAPPDLRVRAAGPQAVAMDRVPVETLDRVAAMRAVPSLIKSYLRLGGFVGQGAWVDQAFRTTDVCLILDTARMSAGRTDRIARGRG
ncbi:GNAT family N-acetyltransferase [Maribius pontilimi]|uniref:L-ornithine N(alpha)-acyltransferase n=1 Tax=Palleronia pontilimi TaxID=1964209 RepID=A0A934IHV8_9RHOB|nr:GNAT family N-acyltransferase [Palleronia pontilimi]MBJ3762860.1 GNAT family N-acetyltransferase [Palleronia pontilimi]